MSRARVAVAALSVSAAWLIGTAVQENYEPVARPPIKGDKPTLGFGETVGVKLGQTTTPVRALIQLGKSAGRYEQGVRQCVKVPLYQREFDAYVSFAYNLGVGNFCGAAFVERLNAGDYEGACKGMATHPNGKPAWSNFNGKYLQGLQNRRVRERDFCLGLREALHD